jgi:hypothetical protein
MPEVRVGVVTHYFGRIGVATVQATDGPIAVGDTIHINGAHTDHTQADDSLQSEQRQTQRIEPGQGAGIKVGCHAQEHDLVYKVTA